MTPDRIRSVTVLLFLFALLCEHADFDRIREEYSDARTDIDCLTTASVSETAFNKLIDIYYDDGLSRIRPAALTALGFLYRRYPTLVNREESIDMMDQIFQSSDQPDGKLRLLGILQDFLTHQAVRFADDNSQMTSMKKQSITSTLQKPKNLHIEELIGNVDGFADSGVGSAVVQRFLPYILSAALSAQPAPRNTALEIISFTVKLGLAHPVQCLPTIIALETSSESAVVKKAFNLHTTLHTKHAVLVNTRYLECTRSAFVYRKSLASDVDPRGYSTDINGNHSVLHLWYSLVKEKRTNRLEFVKALSKVFDVDPVSTCTSTDVAFARFMADCLATIEYKAQEDIFVLLRALDRSLADNAMQTVTLMQEQAESVDSDMVSRSRIDSVSFQSVAYTGMILLIAQALRNHLKLLYGLTDVKCAKFNPAKKTSLGDKVPSTTNSSSLFLSEDEILAVSAIPTELTNTACLRIASIFEDCVLTDVSVQARVGSDEEE